MTQETELRAREVPLVEQLERVPADARLYYEVNPTHHMVIPVGRLCQDAARGLRAFENTLEKERANTRPSSPTPFADAISALERHYYTDGELAQWLESPQPQCGGLTPLEMLAAGRKAELLAIVQRLDDGVYL